MDTMGIAPPHMIDVQVEKVMTVLVEHMREEEVMFLPQLREAVRQTFCDVIKYHVNICTYVCTLSGDIDVCSAGPGNPRN